MSAYWVLLPAVGMSVVAGFLNVGIAYLQENPNTAPATVLRPAEEIVERIIGQVEQKFGDDADNTVYSAFGDEPFSDSTHDVTTPIEALSLELAERRSGATIVVDCADSESEYSDQFDFEISQRDLYSQPSSCSSDADSPIPELSIVMPEEM